MCCDAGLAPKYRKLQLLLQFNQGTRLSPCFLYPLLAKEEGYIRIVINWYIFLTSILRRVKCMFGYLSDHMSLNFSVYPYEPRDLIDYKIQKRVSTCRAIALSL